MPVVNPLRFFRLFLMEIAMPDNQDISRQSLDFAHALQFEHLPNSVVEAMKQSVFDLLCSAIGGSNTSKADCIRRIFKHHPAHGNVPAFGLREFLSLRDAGFVNGACGHILETDDSDRTGLSHPGVMVITPALLAATACHKSGKDLISACVAGYEVMLRVGTALGLPHYAVWHTTGTTGVLGGVISAGKVMELSREKLTHAFGNAGTLSCGLWEFNKTHAMSKILHVGVGVSNALLCVELAQEGFTGAEKILEGTQGLFAGFNRSDADWSVFNDYGKLWRSAGVSFKPYPCCRHTHGGIDCGLALHEKGIAHRLEHIREIRIETYNAAYQIVSSRHCQSAAEAKFSLPYTVCVALLTGCVTEDSFSEEAIRLPQLQHLLACTKISVADDIQAVHPYHEQCRVTVRFDNKSEETVYVKDPLGEPENPMTWEGLRNKGFDEVKSIVPKTVFNQIYDTCRELDGLDDCAPFYALLQKQTVR